MIPRTGLRACPADPQQCGDVLVVYGWDAAALRPTQGLSTPHTVSAGAVRARPRSACVVPKRWCSPSASPFSVLSIRPNAEIHRSWSRPRLGHLTSRSAGMLAAVGAGTRPRIGRASGCGECGSPPWALLWRAVACLAAGRSACSSTGRTASSPPTASSSGTCRTDGAASMWCSASSGPRSAVVAAGSSAACAAPWHRRWERAGAAAARPSAMRPSRRCRNVADRFE